MSRKRIYAAGAAVHLLLIVTVCCRDTFGILSKGYTLFPSILNGVWQRAEGATSDALGQGLSKWNPLRQGVKAYLHFAGIEAGYGFFAPNVPQSHKLIFELHYADGRTDYEVPRVNGMSSGLRITTLLDYIGQVEDKVVREGMIKFLVYSVWRDHPDATAIRAVFGIVRSPSVTEFEQGKRESYESLYAYDFSPSPKSVESVRP